MIQIGLFGFGVVGGGIYKVLEQKPQIGVSIKKIVIKHADKWRDAPTELFSVDAGDILNDDSIDLVVELIDDSEAAYHIVKSAFESGKSVVSANKKMIAEHHSELIELSRQKGVSFLYEAAVCGSVPIIRNLEEYFDNDLLTHIKGIVNGSTNYILTQMSQHGSSYAEALQAAQSNGFAESNPSLDVEGIDAVNKLSIISLHAFGSLVDAKKILRKGITALHISDFQYAKEKDLSIKLLAHCKVDANGKPELLSVLPAFVPKTNALSQTHNEYNGVLVGSTLADEQFFYGKGAGRFPTSSAVLSDISAYKYGYKYEYKKGVSRVDAHQMGSGKFMLSYASDLQPDLSCFDSVEERYQGQERSYVVGRLAYSKLESHDWLTNPEWSLIGFN